MTSGKLTPDEHILFNEVEIKRRIKGRIEKNGRNS